MTWLLTGGAGYPSAPYFRDFWAMGIDPLVAGPAMRRSDERFPPQERHREEKNPLHDKGAPSKRKLRKLEVYQPSDFTYDAEARTCVWPAAIDAAKRTSSVACHRSKSGSV